MLSQNWSRIPLKLTELNFLSLLPRGFDLALSWCWSTGRGCHPINLISINNDVGNYMLVHQARWSQRTGLLRIATRRSTACGRPGVSCTAVLKVVVGEVVGDSPIRYAFHVSIQAIWAEYMKSSTVAPRADQRGLTGAWLGTGADSNKVEWEPRSGLKQGWVGPTQISVFNRVAQCLTTYTPLSPTDSQLVTLLMF